MINHRSHVHIYRIKKRSERTPTDRRELAMEGAIMGEQGLIHNDEDLISNSEYDHDNFTDDDVGSECSCSTCSTCSTCSSFEDELEPGESYDEEDLQFLGCEKQMSNDVHYCNDNTDFLEKPQIKNNELQFSGENGFPTEEFIIKKFGNVVVLKADASQFKNGGYLMNGEQQPEEILLGGKQRKKKVHFIDSSSSSDDVAQAEAYSISSFSDSSTSGSYPGFTQPLQNGDHFTHKEVKSQEHIGNKSNLSQGEMEREYHRLRSVLKTIDPLKLHGILKHSLKAKDPETIMALRTLLPKSKFTADTVHCVRCHKEYDPHYGRKRCTLYHPEKDVWKISQNSQGANFKCSLCSTAFTLKGAWDYKLSTATEQDCGVCFEGVHTPDPDEVSYQPTGGAAQCCEDKGCIVFYV